MAKFFPLVKKVVQRVLVPVGDGGEVITNKIRIDYRDKLKRLLTTEFIGLRTLEKARFRTVDALVVIAKAFHTIKFREVTFVRAVATVQNRLAKLVESNFIGLRTFERQHARLSHFIGLRTFEFSRVLNTVFVRATASVSDTINYRTSEFIGLRTFETAARSRTEQTFTVSATGYAESVVQQTNFDNPNNALGNTTNTAATSTIAAGGLAGTTAATENYTITVDLPDVNLANLLQTVTNAQVFIEHSASFGGVNVGGSADYQGFVGINGAADQPVFTVAATSLQAQAKTIASADITALIANNFANINTLRLRVTGTNSSGVGLGANAVTSVFRLWYTFTGEGVNAN